MLQVKYPVQSLLEAIFGESGAHWNVQFSVTKLISSNVPAKWVFGNVGEGRVNRSTWKFG